jgi:hypothetical protein
MQETLENLPCIELRPFGCLVRQFLQQLALVGDLKRRQDTLEFDDL